MKIHIVATLVVGTLVCLLAGCNSSEFKPQQGGGEEQSKMITPGQPLKAPSGAPGMEKVGQPGGMPMGGGKPGQPMQPPMGAPMQPPTGAPK